MIYHKIMNPEAQERLDEILKKDPKELTPEDIGFIRARRGYLKKSQEEEYAEVLKDKKEDTKETKPSEEPKTVNKKDGNTK